MNTEREIYGGVYGDNMARFMVYRLSVLSAAVLSVNHKTMPHHLSLRVLSKQQDNE